MLDILTHHGIFDAFTLSLKFVSFSKDPILRKSTHSHTHSHIRFVFSFTLLRSLSPFFLFSRVLPYARNSHLIGTFSIA